VTAKRDPAGDAELREAILTLATGRGAEKTICPSEVARHIGGNDETQWRPLMPIIRRLAVELVAKGEVQIKKGGEVVDLDTFDGIYRIAIKT